MCFYSFIASSTYNNNNIVKKSTEHFDRYLINTPSYALKWAECLRSLHLYTVLTESNWCHGSFLIDINVLSYRSFILKSIGDFKDISSSKN